MAENTPDQKPAHTAPVDYRPQPRYGELAPEGWTWTPPQEDLPAASATVSESSDAAAVPLGTAQRTAPAQVGVRAPAPTWDRVLTLGLLFAGLLGTFFIISMLGSMTEALQMLYTQAELGDYSPAAGVAPLITGGSIGQAVVWLATAVVSVLLVLRHKRAFYVPLIGGVVSFVLLVAIMTAVLAGDAALLDYFSRP